VLVVREVEARPGEEESVVEIAFSAGVDADAVLGHLAIEPKIALRAKASRNRVTLRGPLRPESRYTLTLRAGLVAQDGATLAEPYRTELTLAPLPPALGFRGEGMFLPARGSRRLALETTNVERVTLTIDRVYRNNVLYLVQQQGYAVWQTQGHGRVAHVFGDRLVEEEIEIGGPRNALHTTEIRVDEKVGEHEPGFYRVAVQRPDSWAMEQRWLLVTDLGVVAKRSDEDLLVWVSSFDDLSPVVGASVRVVSDQNQLVAQIIKVDLLQQHRGVAALRAIIGQVVAHLVNPELVEVLQRRTVQIADRGAPGYQKTVAHLLHAQRLGGGGQSLLERLHRPLLAAAGEEDEEEKDGDCS
jgi:hypothetical protein